MKLKGLSHEIFMERYAYPGDTNWDDRADTIARIASSAESDDLKEVWRQHFWMALSEGDFIPGGRIIFGAGRPKFNLLNCYVLWPEDNVESISQVIKDSYLISCGGGGIGYDFSLIRPRGDDIQNIKNSAPGAVSNMKMINEIGEHVRSGKNRRTALMGILRVDHPDLFEFLDAKLDKQTLNNFNISVAVTNDFLSAVNKNKEWNFTFNGRRYDMYKVSGTDIPNGGSGTPVHVMVAALSEEDALGRANNHFKPTYTTQFKRAKLVKTMACDIWDKLFKSAIECGDPGIYNVDLANSYTNVSYFEYLPSTNPCGEITIPAYGNCCLGHLNLSNMVDWNGRVQWKKMAKTIRAAVRFLDNILSINHFAVPECREVGHRSRRIGLGVTGLHYFLIKAGYRYGDESCCEFVERLFQTIRDESYKASIEVAKEKGSFTAFDAEKYLEEDFAKTLPPRIRREIKKHGIRNAVMLTCAPCGTNSMVLGVSTGIEPLFSPIYERKYRDNNVWKEQLVVDPLFRKLYETGDDRMQYCIGAYDVTPEEHIRIQASIQKYVDQSLSKTCNLPKNTKYSDIKDIILDYAHDVKGFTIYREASRGVEPLKAISVDNMSSAKIEVLMQQAVGYGTEESSPSACSINGGECE
jgi:ribonucleoside-diphosphate reductase alpha chain